MPTTTGKKARREIGGKKSQLKGRGRKPPSAEKLRRWSQMSSTKEARRNNAIGNFLGERTVEEPTS
jgi:hypothetical protein